MRSCVFCILDSVCHKIRFEPRFFPPVNITAPDATNFYLNKIPGKFTQPKAQFQ